MDKKQMILDLVDYYHNGNKKRFAEMLGLAPQTINAWILRNTFDAELIYTKCVGVSAKWLLSGQGNMLESEDQACDSGEEYKTILKELLMADMAITSAEARKKELFARIAEMI